MRRAGWPDDKGKTDLLIRKPEGLYRIYQNWSVEAAEVAEQASSRELSGRCGDDNGVNRKGA